MSHPAGKIICQSALLSRRGFKSIDEVNEWR
jgi:hypothetical protein